MDNVYLNVEFINDTSTNQHIEINEDREPYVLPDPNNYYIAIDRFNITHCLFPLFEHSKTLTVKVIRRSDSVSDTTDLDLSASLDADSFLYDLAPFVTAFNTALGTSVVVLGGTTGPTLSLDKDIKSTLDFTGSDANFVDDYYIELNEPLYAIFNTFPYQNIVFQQLYFRLLTTANITTNEKCNFMPVSHITVKTSTIPVVYEMKNSARNTINMLTDFEISGRYSEIMNDVNYTSTEGQYRFHDMSSSGSFNKVNLSFHFNTYNHNEKPLYLLSGGSCSVKLYFKRK